MLVKCYKRFPDKVKAIFFKAIEGKYDIERSKSLERKFKDERYNVEAMQLAAAKKMKENL